MVATTSETSGQPTALIRGRIPASRWLIRAAQLMVLAAVLVLAWQLLEQVGWSKLWLQMKGASRVGVIAAAAALTGRFLLLYLRWSLVLGAAGFRPTWLLGQSAQLAAVLVNHLTPTARLFGGILRARCVSRQLDQPFSKIYATVLVDQVSHQIVLGSATWLALIAVAAWSGFTGLAIGLGLSLVLIVGTLAIWRQKARSDNAQPIATLIGLKAERRGKRLGPLFAGGRELFRSLRQSFSDVALQTRMAATGILIFSLNVAAQWLIFDSLGTPVRLVAIGAAIALGLAAGLVTGTPGGVATTEAAMVGLYVSFGVDGVEATAGVLLYRGIHYLLVLTLGLPSLVYCGATKGKQRRARSALSEGALPDSATLPVESPPDPGE
jgi:uncharacterized protein (TIRG00374 family)